MPTCDAYIEPLDLQCILVNTLAGSPTIFLLLSYLVIASISAFFRLTGMTLVLLIFLFTLIVGATGVVNVDIFIVILWTALAYVVYAALSKVFKN